MSWSLALTHHSLSRWRATAVGNRKVCRIPKRCSLPGGLAVSQVIALLLETLHWNYGAAVTHLGTCQLTQPRHVVNSVMVLLWLKKKCHCWWLKLCLSTEFYLNSSITEQLLLLYLTAPPPPAHPQHHWNRFYDENQFGFGIQQSFSH